MLEQLFPDTALLAPAIETLFSRDEKSLWPSEALCDPDLIRQTELRQKCLQKLEALFRQIPDPTIEVSTAVETGTVRSETIAELYELLAVFFDADPRHRRLALYLPFEIIPAQTWRPEFKPLSVAVNRFIISYLRCWRELLEESDVRANFVDGNILEPELCPNGQQMVRKAAHFIPQFLKKRLISIPEVIALLDSSSSEILKSSIADTILRFAQMSLLTEKECENILQSHGFSASMTAKSANKIAEEIDSGWLKKLPDEIAFELKKIEMRAALDQARKMPPARIAWEKQIKEDVLISACAERIAQLAFADTTGRNDVLMFLSTTSEHLARLATIRGIGIAVEQLAKTARDKATSISRKFVANIRTLWMNGESAVRDEIESVLTHWTNLGIFTEAQLCEFGLGIPKFDATFSNTGPLASEITKFSATIMSIVNNPDISRILYPVMLFYGSRLKGYAKRNADLDVAVFVRPGVPKNDREMVRQVLAQALQGQKIDGKMVEFWLKTKGLELQIYDFSNPDVFLADSTWVHVLFAGVWLGQKKALAELYAKLLPGFLRSGNRKFKNYDIRKLWLDEMEREVLQYRLMHKGYRRFFPAVGGMDVPGTEKLDLQSVFWDSGYRRLATKLFIARVFLPQLKMGKKLRQ